MAVLVADRECIKCYLIGLDEFQYDAANQVKSLEEYVKQLARALKKLNLFPTQDITIEIWNDSDTPKTCLVGFVGDGVFLAELDDEKEEKVPIIDRHIHKHIQDTPLVQKTRQDLQHQRQNSWNGSAKGTELVWKRNLTSKGINTLRTPKLFNWGYNVYQQKWDANQIDPLMNRELLYDKKKKEETRKMPSLVFVFYIFCFIFTKFGWFVCFVDA